MTAAMPSAQSLITAAALTQSYVSQDRSVVAALSDVSLEVAPGEFVTIVGPSGCGKTTLLRIMAGLLRPTSGTVHLLGRPVTGPSRSVGVVFQDPVLLPWRTVLDNVMLPVQVLRLERERYRARALDLLGLVGLRGFEGKYPHELSGGMRQRVSLARALVHDPALLLMDEPFGALDEMTRERLNIELLELWRRMESTIVFVTHSISEAVFLSTRVVVMSPRPGRIAGTVEVDLPQPRTVDTREEPRFFELVTQVRELLRGVGADEHGSVLAEETV